MIPKSTWRVLCPALVIGFSGGFQFGFQGSIMNPSEKAFTNFINSSFNFHYDNYLNDNQWMYLWPTIVNMDTLGAFFGTLLIRYLLENLGRKKIFYLSNLTTILTCLIQGISKSTNCWEILMIGRFLAGIALGIQIGIQPVYLNEISPKSIRGLIGATCGSLVEFRFLTVSIVGLEIIFGNDKRWPYLFLIAGLPAAVSLFVLPFLPESPKFLAGRGDSDGAKKALKFFGRDQNRIKEELKEIRREIARDSLEKSTSMSVKELFTIPYVRKGVLLGWLIIFSTAFNGFLAVAYFSTSIFQTAGLSSANAQYATIATAATTFLGALSGGLIVDRFGRRPIILTANTIIVSLNILFFIFAHSTRVYSIGWTSYACIPVVAFLCFFNGLGPSCVLWFLTVELLPQRARAQMLAMLIQWTCLGLAALIFYPLKRAVDEFCFLLHIIPLLISIVIFARALPETKNKSTLEIIRKLGYLGDDSRNEANESIELIKSDKAGIMENRHRDRKFVTIFS